MLDLSEGSIAAWKSRLPSDVVSALSDSAETASEGSGALTAALAESPAWQVPEVVRQHPEDVRAFGRARRIRLMAWVARQTFPDCGAVFRRLTEDEEGGSGAGAVGLLFLEDIQALAEAMGPRIARRMTSEAAMDAVVQAAVTLESDMAFRQGGL